MKIVASNCDVAMGIDVSVASLSITILSGAGEPRHATIQHNRAAIESFLSRLPGCRIRAAYEAGCTGFWLYDTLKELGVEAIVTPPSKMLRSPGDRVKTNRRDSETLAIQLRGGLLKAVDVPSKERRAARQLVRTYRQLMSSRVQSMLQIRSFLEFHHLKSPPGVSANWSGPFLHWLETLDFSAIPAGQYLRQSLDALLKLYRQLTEQVAELRKQIHQLSCSRPYQQASQLLQSQPGIGLLTATTILTEIGRVERFENSQQFSSYIGLTPSEHSTGDEAHRGHITRAGNRHIRGLLVECAWMWIGKDKAAYATYRRLARRREPKRAIVAMGRRLATRLYWQLRNLKAVELPA